MRGWKQPLGLLESAYRLDGTDEEWIAGMVDALSRILPNERIGTIGFAISGRIDKKGRTVLADFHTPCGRGAGEVADLRGVLRRQLNFPAELVEKLYFSSLTAETLSVATGFGAGLPRDPSWRELGWDSVVRDSLGLVCHDGPLNCVVLSVALDEITTLSKGHRRIWQRLASHVGAALRLRRGGVMGLEQSAAVLSPTGKLEQLSLAADETSVREGFARRRHARSRNVPADAALEVWQGLHDGRWSLVDYVDTDGKAFVLAVRNEPAREVASALTDRQRAAVALAALGYSNKQIAYALGLTAAAVAMLLARARLASGARTRTDLVCAFKRTLAGRTSLSFSDDPRRDPS